MTERCGFGSATGAPQLGQRVVSGEMVIPHLGQRSNCFGSFVLIMKPANYKQIAVRTKVGVAARTWTVATFILWNIPPTLPAKSTHIGFAQRKLNTDKGRGRRWR